MKTKINCWEYKNCGRVPYDLRNKESGICPVYTAKQYDKINDGLNGGRLCWKVAGTFCGGKMQGAFAQKISTCLSCNFVQLVVKEQGESFRFL